MVRHSFLARLFKGSSPFTPKRIFNLMKQKTKKKKKYMLINIMKQNYSLQNVAAYRFLLILELKVEKTNSNRSLYREGLLHRGTKFLIEYKTYIQSMLYLDCLDYVSTILQEHTFCLCIKYLKELNIYE